MKLQETPLIQVGKHGLTDSMVRHIARILHQKRSVRVKFLRSFPKRETIRDVAAQLKEDAQATRMVVRGFIITLWKDR